MSSVNPEDRHNPHHLDEKLELTNDAASSAANTRDRRASQDLEKGDEPSFFLPPPKAWLVAVSALVCIVAGIMCVLAVKLQNRSNIPVCGEEDCEESHFTQPFWQTFIMFSGESFCLITYFWAKWRRDRRGDKVMLLEFPKSAEDLKRRRIPWYWWGTSAVLDLTGTALINMAFTMSYASTIQMLRNSLLLITSFFSLVMIRRPLKVHEMAGVLVMTVGMVVAGLQAIRNPEEETDIDEDKAWLGIVLTLVGTVFNALQLIIEEWMFKRAYAPPMLAMGSQGMIGWVLNIIVIIVCHYAGWYNFKEGWYQMHHSGEVLAGNLWYLVVVFLFNGAGICVTNLGSGLLRAVTYSVRAPIVWIIELILSWQSYAWEQLVALILSAVGFALYAYILPGVNKKNLPKTTNALKYQVPCFCTNPIPESEDDDDNVATVDKPVPVSTPDVVA